MDRLDRASLLALAALIAVSVVLMRGHEPRPKPDPDLQLRIAAARTPEARAELEAGATAARNLIESGNLGEAEALIRELQRKFPYQGEPHMLMGDLRMRRQQPVPAMEEYKSAIELDPDYLDKKTPRFQGKKLKVAVGEALSEIERHLAQKPGDAALKRQKKVIYYLYRKIAGSCG